VLAEEHTQRRLLGVDEFEDRRAHAVGSGPLRRGRLLA
jgi:hypothetical protein